jgi:hypothetical protein
MSWRLLAALGATVVVGFVAGRAVRGVQDGAGGRHLVDADPSVILARSCPEEVVTRVRVAEAQRTFHEEQLRALRAEEMAIMGAPAPFPEDLPQAFRPDNVERELARLLDSRVHRVAASDCDEYPCLVAVYSSFPVGEEHEDLEEEPPIEEGFPSTKSVVLNGLEQASARPQQIGHSETDSWSSNGFEVGVTILAFFEPEEGLPAWYQTDAPEYRRLMSRWKTLREASFEP